MIHELKNIVMGYIALDEKQKIREKAIYTEQDMLADLQTLREGKFGFLDFGKICNKWRILSQNTEPWTANILKQAPRCVDWSVLCQNPAPWVLDILMNNFHRIDWTALCSNTAEWVEIMLMANRDEIRWDVLCANPAPWVERMLAYLKYPTDEIWQIIWQNPAPWVEPILIGNLAELDQEDWMALCNNTAPWVERILRKHSGKINKDALLKNPALWTCRLCSDLQILPQKSDKWNAYKSHIIKMI